MNINNLESVIKNYPLELESNPQKIKKFFKGFSDQVERLQDSIKDLFPSQNERFQIHTEKQLEIQKCLYSQLEEIKTKTIKNTEYIDKKQKIDFFNELSDIITYCENNSNKLNEIINKKFLVKNEKEFIHKNKSNEKEIYDNLKQHYSNYEREKIPLLEKFKKAELKLIQFKTKCELQNTKNKSIEKIIDNYLEWFKKLINRENIVAGINHSSNQDDKRINDFTSLQEKYLQAFSSYITYESQIENLLIKYKIMPLLEHLHENINNIKAWYLKLNTSLNQISLHKLDSIFNEKNFPDLEAFFQDVEIYQIQKGQTKSTEKELSLIKDSMEGYFSKIEKSFQTIEEKIKYFQDQNKVYFENQHSIDLDEKIILKKIHIEDCLNTLQLKTKENFNKLKEEIANKWTQCCINLNEIHYPKTLFENFHNDNENLTLCYMLAMEIHYNLRKLKKEENLQERHKIGLQNNLFLFKVLSNLINKIDTNVDYNLNNSITSKLSNYLSTKAFNLCHDLTQRLKFSAGLHYPKDMNFKFLTQDETVRIQQELENQKILFNNNVENQKEELINCLKKLKMICENHVVFGINFEVNNLNWFKDDPRFLENFTESYFAKNPTGRFFQKLGSYALQSLASITNNENFNDNYDDTSETNYSEGEDLKVEIFHNPSSDDYSITEFQEVSSPFNSSNELFKKL